MTSKTSGCFGPGRRDTRLIPYGRAGEREPSRCRVLKRGAAMLKAIADILRSIGGAVATVVTLPFHAIARLFGGASDSAHGRH